MSLGVVKCNSNSLLIQWVDRRGQIEKQRQLIALKQNRIELYFMTQLVVMTFMVQEKALCPLICMYVYLFIHVSNHLVL